MPTDFDPEEAVLVGRMGRPHGLAGSVTVELFTDAPERRFTAGTRLFLDDGSIVTVARFQLTEKAPLLALEGVNDRTAAERLRGRSLFIHPTDRRPLDEGEFWPDELEGMEVVDRSGQVIGTTVGVDVGQGQDRLRVQIEDREVSVPFVEEIVPEVDHESRRIIVDLPEGLTD